MTVLEKLHKIEEVKIIYNIHYCRAGVGFIFYYPQKVLNPKNTKKYYCNTRVINLKYPINWKEGLSVDTYYPTFEKAVKAEYKKLE